MAAGAEPAAPCAAAKIAPRLPESAVCVRIEGPRHPEARHHALRCAFRLRRAEGSQPKGGSLARQPTGRSDASASALAAAGNKADPNPRRLPSRLRLRRRRPPLSLRDPADGKIRLHACKWTHQEIVIDVKISATRIQVFLFSTAADPNNSNGTGIRAYSMTPAGVLASFLNVLFGFTHPVPNEKVAILDACFVNPSALKRT